MPASAETEGSDSSRHDPFSSQIRVLAVAGIHRDAAPFPTDQENGPSEKAAPTEAARKPDSIDQLLANGKTAVEIGKLCLDNPSFARAGHRSSRMPEADFWKEAVSCSNI